MFTGLLKEPDQTLGTNEYLFRDSLDHSSSESQLVGTSHSHRSSRSQTPVLRAGSKLPLPPPRPSPVPTNQRSKSFSLLRVFIPSFLLTALWLIVIVIIILETDYEVLGFIRRSPEMVTLRRLYYEPTKEYFKAKFSSKVSNTRTAVGT